MDDIVKIELFGEEFRFKPDKDVKNSEKVAESLKLYVTKAEEQFRTKVSGNDRLTILLLAAMNISKDFYELQIEYSRLETYVADRASSLLKKITNGI
ncbi:MAG: cell division protein ZapA [Thermodesulfobacteriota bacterium]|nr:cell division protein ZapA [Thermodesulfobacteriota bacterium]